MSASYISSATTSHPREASQTISLPWRLHAGVSVRRGFRQQIRCLFHPDRHQAPRPSQPIPRLGPLQLPIRPETSTPAPPLFPTHMPRPASPPAGPRAAVHPYGPPAVSPAASPPYPLPYSPPPPPYRLARRRPALLLTPAPLSHDHEAAAAGAWTCAGVPVGAGGVSEVVGGCADRPGSRPSPLPLMAARTALLACPVRQQYRTPGHGVRTRS